MESNVWDNPLGAKVYACVTRLSRHRARRRVRRPGSLSGASYSNLWIPGFSSSVLARFDPRSGDFRTWDLPVEPRGTETPYALNVDRRTDSGGIRTSSVLMANVRRMIRFVDTVHVGDGEDTVIEF